MNVTNPNSILNSNIHTKAKISYGCQIYNSTLGEYSYVGEHSKLINTEVGKFCSISYNVIIGGGESSNRLGFNLASVHKGEKYFTEKFFPT